MQKPEHGWMRCILSIDEDTIEFDASDVPNNPLADLIECLWQCCRGTPSEVWWHLEPAGYYFQFLPQPEQVDFVLLYSEDSSNRRRTLRQVSVPMPGLLLMFWRSAKKVASFGLGEPHWPQVDIADLEKLRNKIENQ